MIRLRCSSRNCSYFKTRWRLCKKWSTSNRNYKLMLILAWIAIIMEQWALAAQMASSWIKTLTLPTRCSSSSLMVKLCLKTTSKTSKTLCFQLLLKSAQGSRNSQLLKESFLFLTIGRTQRCLKITYLLSPSTQVRLTTRWISCLWTRWNHLPASQAL